jgi:Amt family ammonium transporter
MHTGKATALGFASGILAGLVAVTPAAGVVQPWGALVLGAIAAIICYGAILMKNKLGYDDSLDAFGVHGIGGTVGAIFLVFFIRKSWMAEAAAATESGVWTIWNQLGVQLAAVAIAIAYACILSLIIVFVLDKTIGFRSDAESEMAGLDKSYHGEQGYGLVTAN